MKSYFLLILLAVSIRASAQNAYLDSHYELQVFTKDGKSGIRELYSLRIEVPAIYDCIIDLHDNLILYKEGYRGLFSLKFRKIVLPVEYEDISVHQIESIQNAFIVLIKKNGACGLLDQNYNSLLNMEYKNIEPNRTHATLYNTNNLRGVYFYKSSQIRIPIVYDYIECDYKSQYFIATKNSKYFLYDNFGSLVSGNNNSITYFYHWLEEERKVNDFKIIDSNQRVGIYNTDKKKYILPCVYNNITEIYKGQYIVKNTAFKFGMVNHLNVVTLLFNFDSLAYSKPSESNTMIAYKGKACGLVNRKTMFSTEFIYDNIEDINGYYKALKDLQYTIIDSMGNRITAETYDHIGCFYRDTCTVIKNNVINYMSSSGQLLQGFPQDITTAGFSNIRDMYTNFVVVLRSENDSLIKDFCKKVIYDDYTLNYLIRTGHSYRGVPSQMIKHNFTCDSAVNIYYKEIMRLYQRLKELDELQCLTLNDIENDFPFGYLMPPLNIKLMEPRAILATSNKIFDYKLGELVYIEGYWKVFTKPNSFLP